MPVSARRIVVFIHGWSVHNTNTYGGFPARLKAEAETAGDLELDLRHIWLSKYVSFRDEVRMEDLARGFEEAIQRELGEELAAGRRFVCITHSTGGPVARLWWENYYAARGRPRRCPMSHLIMLAPANFGSALAVLGKARLGRLKSWFEGIEPGTGVLDWLELGSPESWELNMRWMEYPDTMSGRRPVFPFVLTGQRIDRAFYDHLNSYTGEPGSDGVVRVAAANLNFNYVRLVQETIRREPNRPGHFIAPRLRAMRFTRSRPTAFGLVPRSSHSGDRMGILRSVKDDQRGHPVLTAVLECLRVRTGTEYTALRERFEARNLALQDEERVEIESLRFRTDRHYIHDPHSMVIFRVQDDRGYPIPGFDLRFTAGKEASVDHLPEGFFRDRQANSRHPGTLTYFVNSAIMLRGKPVLHPANNKELRPASRGAQRLGFEIEPHQTEGFVHHLKASLNATSRDLRRFIRPHEVTLIDIRMRRVVRDGIFELSRNLESQEFKTQDEGDPLTRERS